MRKRKKIAEGKHERLMRIVNRMPELSSEEARKRLAENIELLKRIKSGEEVKSTKRKEEIKRTKREEELVDEILEEMKALEIGKKEPRKKRRKKKKQ